MPLTDPSTDARPVDYVTEECLLEVTVTIKLSAGVACPGHPLQIDAIGKPAGGTCQWTVSGGTAQLVDGAGKPATTGSTVYLWAFKADDATGNVPEQEATVGVTYTHPNGPDTDSKNIRIHKIDFVIKDLDVDSIPTEVEESATGVRMGQANLYKNTIWAKTHVQIQLDTTCPRKAPCAANHRVGWLQTVLTNDRWVRYTHTLVEWTLELPIRDQVKGALVFPFSGDVTAFVGNNDTRTVFHEDSPGWGTPWEDKRPEAPAPPPPENLQLREVMFSNRFMTWLVVQNIEWSERHLNDSFAYLANSFAYLANIDWALQLHMTVKTANAIGSRCKVESNVTSLPNLKIGRGEVTPVLTAPYSNEKITENEKAAPKY